jgi:cold shock CspA family protein
MLQAIKPNSLPLPYKDIVVTAAISGAESITTTIPSPVIKPAEALPPMPEIDDFFPKGRISRYFPHQGYGFITDKNGKNVYFNLNEIDFVGEKAKDSIKIGLPVGYDVSHTSHGLHVKKMKIY